MKKHWQNCWEFWNCPEETKKRCPTYVKGLGERCWTVTECFTTAKHPKPTEKKIEYCRKCLWFKRFNP